MEEVAIDLEHLDILRLDIESDEEDVIEFQLHARVEGIDEDTLAAVGNRKLDPKEVIFEVGPREPSN